PAPATEQDRPRALNTRTRYRYMPASPPELHTCPGPGNLCHIALMFCNMVGQGRPGRLYRKPRLFYAIVSIGERWLAYVFIKTGDGLGIMRECQIVGSRKAHSFLAFLPGNVRHVCIPISLLTGIPLQSFAL